MLIIILIFVINNSTYGTTNKEFKLVNINKGVIPNIN